MTEAFGDNLAYTDTSLVEFGIKERSFKNFRDAAWEASMSRLYGGIHYSFDLYEGNKQGKILGELVVNRLRMRRSQQSAGLATK
jgi:hypothetical protein